MSPIGGVGINLAIQDAVAAANLLAAPLRRGDVTEAELAAVQRRRETPTKLTQWVQLLMQRNMISPLLESANAAKLPLPVRLMMRAPVVGRLVARLLARFMAIGFRNEHVRSAPRTDVRQTTA
jgi:2-polyprenyl-6-methoxyphenol hydroxylase-like FAD-dependent oxidoreductase